MAWAPQLQLVRLMGLGPAPLVLHREGEPKSFFSVEGYALWVGVELHHITFPGDAQRGRDNGQPPEDQEIAPALPRLLIVGAAVEQIALHRAKIVLPLLFDVDQRPLAAAEGEVLDAGELEEVLLGADHPRR